ncbi:MAG: hypothetical protein K2X39_00485 [Silvanigrellaceae bacterium]|nr:hypothetical protein [Silvanigrellaceae bacterium]
MAVSAELFLIHLAFINNSLRILVRTDESKETKVFPSIGLRNELFIFGAMNQLLHDTFQDLSLKDLEEWLNSSRYKNRIVETFDRDLLFEQNQSLAIVRAVAIPEEFCLKAKGEWFEINSLFSNETILAPDCKLFLRECINLVPYWSCFTPFVFELLPEIFPINELRNYINTITGKEIDPGNFHRRLKKLDILKPVMAKNHQRVHKWEFYWEKDRVLSEQGLIS